VVRKGKASKPTEFGKMVKIQEAENQIITSCEVFEQKPSDSELLLKAVEEHPERLDTTVVEANIVRPTAACWEMACVRHL
jgi:IS5 family transposase